MIEWRQTRDNEELNDYNYSVSEYGDIENLNTGNKLKPSVNNGYLNITLYKFDPEKKQKSFAVSRLVAILYIPRIEGKNVVNHIDGNKLNNHYSNLEWTTQKENIKHANENGLVGYHPKKVIKCDQEGNKLKSFDSVIDAAKDINLTTHAIFKVLRKKNQTAGGYKWKYADEIDNVTHVNDDDKNIAKDINGYEKYQIFPDGRVYSKRGKKFLKPVLNTKGYSYVTLCKDDEKKKNRYVHVLVAEHFIANPQNKPFVNHKDGNRSHNNIDNLEWVTRSENMLHANQLKKQKF